VIEDQEGSTIARPLRIEYPGAYYHIIQRGIERRKIFTSDSDKERFLNYLEELYSRYRIIVHTFCLMDNHYHLLIETPEGNLAKAMHTLNTSYTTYFNKRKNRNGHLFQGRYKSILVEADAYLHHLSRYIHLNPIRAHLVRDPEKYKWSSCRYFLSRDKSPEWLKTGFILGCFDRKMSRAKKLYRDFLTAEIEQEALDVKDIVKKGFIAGDDDFIDWVKETFIKNREEDDEIPILRQLKERITPEEIKKMTELEVKNQKLARKTGIYLSRKHTGKKLKEIAGVFKNIGDTGVSHLHYRMEKERKEDRLLDRTIKKLEKAIMSSVET
jgi:REP element-mobilizing transposase RayT